MNSPGQNQGTKSLDFVLGSITSTIMRIGEAGKKQHRKGPDKSTSSRNSKIGICGVGKWSIKHTIENLQRGISVLTVDEIISITLDQMRKDFRSSREKRYRVSPKTCALFEHEYEVELNDTEWKSIADDVEQCLRNFYSSEIFALIKELPQHRWLEVEDFSFFYLDGAKVWAVIDCSFRTQEGATIIDWKTGRHTNSDVSLQLACYAMYPVKKQKNGSSLRMWGTPILCPGW